jgi:hypothetical protein
MEGILDDGYGLSAQLFCPSLRNSVFGSKRGVLKGLKGSKISQDEEI